jgi:hypothetical protein
MSLQRAPWWMYAVAASFLAYFALVDYTLWSGPGPVGIGVEYGQRGAVLSDIGPGSPAERAGLQPGDRLVAVNGLAVHHALEWNVVGTNFESNRPQRFEIERDGLSWGRASLPSSCHFNPVSATIIDPTIIDL